MRGLPQKGAYETVLRDAMVTDSFDPVGVYVGTRSGQLFGSRDEGKTWHKILEGLPSIACIRCGIFDEGSVMPVRSLAQPRPNSSPSRSSRSRKSRKKSGRR